MFDELIESVQEMDSIVKGQNQPTRCFEFPEPEEQKSMIRFIVVTFLLFILSWLTKKEEEILNGKSQKRKGKSKGNCQW